MRKGNIIIACVLIVLSIAVIIIANTFPVVVQGQITGPDFLPKLTAYILIGLSVILLISNYKKQDKREAGFFNIYAVKAYFTMLALLGYLLAFNTLGFVITTCIFLVGMMRYYSQKAYLPIILLSCIITAMIYGVFRVLLSVPLPTWIIG